MARLSKLFQCAILASIISLMSGCATQPKATNDPYESLNRKTCFINMTADNLFFRPLATLYVTITPNFLQAGIHNMFKNLFTPTTVFNDLAQGRVDFAAADTTRILLNSTLGILGFFDVAAKFFKLPYHYEDFGMTLAYWGATNSKYLIVPILGPRTFRDSFGLPFDIATNPITYLHPFFWKALAVATAAMVDTRAQYLSADPLVAQSFDPYSFVRDAYLQNRQQMINTNNNLKSYREFQAQQLQAFAPSLSASDADDTGMLRPTDHVPSAEPVATGKAAPQPTRAYAPSAAAPHTKQ